MKKVFLWKPRKINSISRGLFGGGGHVKEWAWLCTVVDINGELFDESASSLIAMEIQTNAAKEALEYLAAAAKEELEVRRQVRSIKQ